MTRRLLRYENLFYAAAFLLSLAVRLAAIGQTPLTDSEAVLALQALALSKGQETLISPHPAYLVLSTIWMFLFGGSHWIARFWPALAGSALALCPVLFRRQLGSFPALIMAFLLVFDPSMLAISTQAGSPVLAILFFALFAGLLMAARPGLAGVAAGMAILSGPDLWPGVVGIGLLALAVQLVGQYGGMKGNRNRFLGEGTFPLRNLDWRKLAWYLLGSVFFIGTLFFAFPRGLSAMAGGIPAYLQGWAVPAAYPPLLLVLAVIFYESLLLFLGIWGAVVGLVQKEPLERLLFAWWLIALILALIYPGRQVVSLAWSMVPLAALAARQAVRMLDVDREDWLPTLGQAVLSGLILGFMTITVFSMVNNPQNIANQEYWVRFFGSLVMFFASAVLIAWGWSKAVAINGLTWGISAVLILFMLSTAWNVSGLSGRFGLDLWSGKPALPEEDLLLKTIDQIDQWSPAVSEGNDLVVVGISSPALEWSLRNYSNIRFESQVPISSRPALLITRDQPDLALAVPYRGQGFTLFHDVGWRLLRPQEWLRWLAFRVLPGEVTLKESFILWVRSDLFPGGETAAAPVEEPSTPQENPR